MAGSTACPDAFVSFTQSQKMPFGRVVESRAFAPLTGLPNSSNTRKSMRPRSSSFFGARPMLRGSPEGLFGLPFDGLPDELFDGLFEALLDELPDDLPDGLLDELPAGLFEGL